MIIPKLVSAPETLAIPAIDNQGEKLLSNSNKAPAPTSKKCIELASFVSYLSSIDSP